ncbi:hypothetical protein QBC46DRAFT_367088 [Diplogelasinospora grovesii]|uniref:PNPLA domain-containing protein n=1 Tax=Diplogelasinospora grovesii TaxID=303347 RepID=A0AAN6N026_9PEZI|nr:hypothetical protein QBC46DRAFT_367088 [Diplogelasinospora grovesii]
MVTEEIEICEKCEEMPGDVKCSCGARYCERCFTTKHLARNPKHRRGGTTKTDKAWAWVSGAYATFTDSASRATHFEHEEATKWFGLHIQKVGTDRVTRLVETPRFSRLVEASVYHKTNSPHRQFPSITSFVGETGAGKSTLIRSLIHNAAKWDMFDNLEAPVPGAQTGMSACLPTTGEVNLYLDPDTFGTAVPHFLADCEGMLGGEPAAAQHQKDWSKHGRRYLLESKDGKQIDRNTAVMTIYPRFLYIFSDVICMPGLMAVKLLEWSLVGAHNTVNQSALPALIIVLNGPTIENEAWISDDHDAATRDFFMAVEQEINENATLREMAKKHGDKTMRELLLRNFSTVYVHYIPLNGFKSLGNSGVIMPQIERLARRIWNDAKRVQNERADTWSLFDAKQLGIAFDYAFKHLASGSDEPFDFSQCRQQMSLPATVEGHFAEFLGRCMYNSVHENFDVAAAVMGSCIVRHSLKSERSDLLHPSVVFNKEVKETCRRALDQFLSNSQPCAYVHSETGEKCVNTKTGHAKGHQAAGGYFLAEGNFMDGDFDADTSLGLIDSRVVDTLKAINENVDSNREARRQYAAALHRSRLKSFPNQSFWKESFTLQWLNLFNKGFGHIFGAQLTIRARVCYACLFGRPEYTLPCGHVICFGCLREFDQSSPDEKYPGIAVHKVCVLCASTDEKEGTWPYRIEYCPDLSGIRVLSLDGGGVRGITQLAIVQRLEQFVNLDMPSGEFFDLMVGTSASGLISLGLGVHNLSVEQCILHFKRLCQNGFRQRLLSKTRLIGWFVRLFVPSIYETEPLEESMKHIFREKQLFGHRENASRVAVTTTVDSEFRLLANYNWGDGKRYLNSNIYTWHAARCTSAAPIYFEPSWHDGAHCRDGGLRENNPVQIAVNEARTIWGSEAVFDMILSLGCGQARHPQRQPSSKNFWLTDLLTTLIKTMNGEAAWRKFEENVGQPLRDRCDRLNVHFSDNTEPELDDVGAIGWMEKLAESFSFHYQIPQGPFSPVFGPVSHNSLEVLADRLRASLYFFELRSLTQQDDVFIVKGWICCRLRPDKKSYKSLIEGTSHFQVKGPGQTVTIPSLQEGERLKLDVSFQQQASRNSEPIRIDVKFDHDYLVTISGFPMTLKASSRGYLLP